MKAKQYLTLGLGIVAGFGISVVGVSYASQNLVSNVKQVTPEVAKSIMLNKVPGANILEFSYDGDDKTPKYDGTLIKDNYEYEVDVNAKTGQIIKFEKKLYLHLIVMEMQIMHQQILNKVLHNKALRKIIMQVQLGKLI